MARMVTVRVLSLYLQHHPTKVQYTPTLSLGLRDASTEIAGGWLLGLG